MAILSIFNRKKAAPEKAPIESRKRYIYRPGENQLAWRLEYRGETGYIFRGWDKAYTYKLLDGQIFRGTEDKPFYIIMGSNIKDAVTNQPVLALDEECICSVEDKNRPRYIICRSIDVQGTI